MIVMIENENVALVFNQEDARRLSDGHSLSIEIGSDGAKAIKLAIYSVKFEASHLKELKIDNPNSTITTARAPWASDHLISKG